MLKPLNSKPGDLATKFISIDGKPVMARRSVTYIQLLRDEFIKPNVEQPSQHDDCDTIENAGLQQSQSYVNVVNSKSPKKKVNFRTLVNDECVEDTDFVHEPNSRVKDGTTGSPIKNSFAYVLQDNTIKKTEMLSKLHNKEVVEGVAVAIPIAVVEEVSARFENTLYGWYFIGKRLAFYLVETLHGMERVIESGPWLIRLVPLLLNIWTLDSKLKRDAITTAPLWVKLHTVPIVAYSESGLSLITSQLGRPIMLDSYTSNKCIKSWSRNTYARVIIEVSSNKELMESLVVAIPFPNETRHTLETTAVEYEWEPPRCASCKNFEHNDEHCPKKAKEIITEQTTNQNKDDGFIRVSRKHGKGNNTSKNKQVAGIKLNKPNLNLYYRPVAKSIPEVGETSSKQSHGDVVNQGIQDTQVYPISSSSVARLRVSSLKDLTYWSSV
ncbi:zinc knuckle CX2CX4HX4C containing protein [Tanacetum coccineum]